MTIDDGLKAFLTASPYPIPAVGPRVYLHKAPQGAIDPYIVVYLISSEPLNSQRGTSDLRRESLQFSVFSPKQATTREVGLALCRLLSGFSGTMGTVPVTCCLQTNGRMLFNEATSVHQYALDFLIHYIDQ